MQPGDDTKRQEAIRALINLVLLEGVVLIVVVAIYLQTGKLTHLIFGVLASTAVFAPRMLSWAKTHGSAMKRQSTSND